MNFSDVPKHIKSGSTEIRLSTLEDGEYDLAIRDGKRLGDSQLYQFQLISWTVDAAGEPVMLASGEVAYTDAELLIAAANRGAPLLRALEWAHQQGEQILQFHASIGANEKGRKSITLS